MVLNEENAGLSYTILSTVSFLTNIIIKKAMAERTNTAFDQPNIALKGVISITPIRDPKPPRSRPIMMILTLSSGLSVMTVDRANAGISPKL